MIKSIKLLIVLITLAACKEDKKDAGTPSEIDKSPATSAVDKIGNTNSILIKKSIVLFMMPDTTEINAWQSQYSEEDYAEIVADLTWYPGVAAEQLDSLNIKNQYFDKDSIVIKHTDNSETFLRRKELDGDMVLIHPGKKPIITHSIDFDKDQILDYFDKSN